MLTQAIKWVVFSNVWVSLSVVSFVFYCTQLGLFKFDLPYILIAFFATLFAYNFQRLLKSHISNPSPSERHIWIGENHKTIQLITILSGVVGGAIALKYLSGILLLSAIPFIVIVLLYAGNKWLKLPLRLIPYIKIIAISIVWAVVVYLFPFVHEKKSFDEVDYLFFGISFLFTFALCIPFDIRDLKSDSGKVKTIPSAIGVLPSKVLAIVCVILIAVISFVNGWHAIGFVGLVSCLPIAFTTEDKNELFFTGGIDGLFILVPIVHFILNLV
jgi:hypothetical protein